jgi:hypothetical protein
MNNDTETLQEYLEEYLEEKHGEWFIDHRDDGWWAVPEILVAFYDDGIWLGDDVNEAMGSIRTIF